MGQDRIYVYEDVVKQVGTIFELGSASASGLLRAIKKDKCWALASWNESEVDQLLALLLCHVRADCVGRKRQEGAFKTINQHWSPEICSFFQSQQELEKTLRQLAHLSANCFLYQEAHILVNAFVVEQLLSGTSFQSARFTTSTAYWSAIESGFPPPDMTFARLSKANVHYGLFGELQEGPPPALQIMTRSVIATYYGKYGKLLEGPEDQLMLDNDEIGGDVEDVGDVRTAENTRDGGDTGDAGEAGNAEDTGDAKDAGDKQAGRGNEGGEQEDTEVGNDEEIDGGDQEAGKLGYDGVGDGVDVDGVLEDLELGNNGVGDGAGNQDNRRATFEDVEDSENVVVDPIDGVLADVLAHSFSPSLPRSNSPPGVTAACSVRSHGNKFKFPFISLLTLLQGLTEFLMSGVVV